MLPPPWLSKKIEVLENGCWKWLGYVDIQGYGRYEVQNNYVRDRQYAHRFVYELLRERIPPNREIDHLCKYKTCVHPDHLEVVTSRENVRRSSSVCAVNGRKTHCKYGHEFTPENIYKMKHGRACLMCRRIAGRKGTINAPTTKT